MHQEIECPPEEWCLDYQIERMKMYRDKVCAILERSFWAEPVAYAMARKADADLSPGDRCDALERHSGGIEFYVCR